MVSLMPSPESYDKKLRRHFEEIKEVITAIRSVRKEKNIAPKEALKLMVRSSQGSKYREYLESVIIKLANLSAVEIIVEEPEGAVSFIVKNVEYFVPVGSMVDAGEELKKLEEELVYTQGFLKSVQNKMSNERFVEHAPAQVVEKERQKMSDAEGKIAMMEAQIEKLKGQA